MDICTDYTLSFSFWYVLFTCIYARSVELPPQEGYPLKPLLRRTSTSLGPFITLLQTRPFFHAQWARIYVDLLYILYRRSKSLFFNSTYFMEVGPEEFMCA